MARNRRIEDSDANDGQEDLSVGISRFLASSYPQTILRIHAPNNTARM